MDEQCRQDISAKWTALQSESGAGAKAADLLTEFTLSFQPHGAAGVTERSILSLSSKSALIFRRSEVTRVREEGEGSRGSNEGENQT